MDIYFKDNAKYTGYLGKKLYCTTIQGGHSDPTLWKEPFPYINFSEAFTEVRGQSMTLAQAGTVLNEDNIAKGINIDGTTCDAIVIPFGANNKNFTIPYTLYQKVKAIVIDGVSSIDEFHNSQYVINIMGGGSDKPVDLRAGFGQNGDNTKAIAIKTSSGVQLLGNNYSFYENEFFRN